MPALGGVPQSIGQAFGDIAQEAARGAVQAGKDIAKGTAETVVGVGSSVPQQQKQPGQLQPESADPRVVEKRAAEKRRYDQVLAELKQYRERRQQLDRQIKAETEQQEQAKMQKEAEEKQKKESWTAQMLRRVSGQSHGETAKTKE